MAQDKLVQLRPQVRRFAKLMELRLRANDHKGGWQDDSMRALFRRLKEECDELDEAITYRVSRGEKNVGHEAADVANFAMMITDISGGARTMRALTVVFFILIIAALAIFATPELVGGKARPTPTACRAGVEGKEYCADRFATSQARPGDAAPRRATQTPRGGR